MAIAKLTNTTKISQKEVDTKLQEMFDVCKKHKHTMSKKLGDGQHAKDIKWELKDPKGKKLFANSFPMTAHTQGDGGKNVKPAVTECNKAIEYLNGL